MNKVKSKLFYLKRRFNIDLWAEVIKKRNWKTAQSRRFLIRAERYMILNFFGTNGLNRMFKKNSKKKNYWVSKLRKHIRAFRSIDSNLNQISSKQVDYEHGEYLKKSVKFFKILKILNLKTKKNTSFFNRKKNNKYKFQFYSNLYNNMFLLTNYLFSKKALKYKTVNNLNNTNGYNSLQSFELFKYEVYLRRHVPTKLWTSSFITYYSIKKKKPWPWTASKRQKWWMEKNKISKSLLLYYGFKDKKKFFYLKKNFFKTKIWAKSSSLYLSKLLINILYKTNFFKTFRQGYILIKTTGVTINNSVIKNPYTFCNIGKVLSFPNYVKPYLIKNFASSLYNDHLIINNWPSYYEINLKTLSIVLWREPRKKELKRFISNYSSNSLLWF